MGSWLEGGEEPSLLIVGFEEGSKVQLLHGQVSHEMGFFRENVG